MLGCVRVVVLKEDPSADEVDRVGDHTTHNICWKRSEWCDVGKLQGPVFRLGIEGQTEKHSVPIFKEVVNWIEDPWKRHISNQWNFDTSKEATSSFFEVDLSHCVPSVCVLSEPDNFESSLNDY